MSPIHSATPLTLNSVWQGVDYPPWYQAMEKAVSGLKSSFCSSGVGNDSVRFQVLITLNPHSGLDCLTRIDSVKSLVPEVETMEPFRTVGQGRLAKLGRWTPSRLVEGTPAPW